MNHLFVSYSRKESDIVSRFTDLLREGGVEIWQDNSGAGSGIPFSTKWSDVIKEALYMASGAIVFRSGNWEGSAPCQKEYELIEKCEIPYLELDPAAAENDPDGAVEQVRIFLERAVDTPVNELRTRLFSSAFEYQAGTDPYQLIPHTRGVLRSALYILGELRQMKSLAKQKQYESRNQWIYPYMQNYLRFAGRTAVLRICCVGAAAVMAVVAAVLILAVPQSLEQGTRQNQNTYAGLAAAGRIAERAGEDPVAAAEIAVGLDESYLTGTSYFSLFGNSVRLLDANLPARVLTENDGLYSELEEREPTRESALFAAECPKGSGSLVITERSTGSRQTLNAPCPVDAFSWSNDGERLLYAAGRNVFVYDAVGKGAPVRLSENFQQIARVGFTELDGGQYAFALTRRDTALLWKLPEKERVSDRGGVNYGIFTESMTPEAVFIHGNEIVISTDGAEKVFAPAVEGDIVTPYYDITSDGSRIAFLCKSGGQTRILCVSLETGEILSDVETEHTATAVAFTADGSGIFASAYECGILRVDTVSGKVEYGPYDSLYFSNITRYGDEWLLTDFSGICCVFDSALNMRKDCGPVNNLSMACFALAVNAEKGYLFTVNRGGGFTPGCSRFQVETGQINLLVVPEMEKVDANTAVAVSDDGAYVAFGYPNGAVRVYEEDDLYLVFESQGLGEAVSAIRFSEDNSRLYLLGSTGNLYTLELPDYVLSSTPDARSDNWNALVTRLTEKMNAYSTACQAQQTS